MCDGARFQPSLCIFGLKIASFRYPGNYSVHILYVVLQRKSCQWPACDTEGKIVMILFLPYSHVCRRCLRTVLKMSIKASDVTFT